MLRWECWWALDLTMLKLYEDHKSVVLSILQIAVKTAE